MRRTSQAQSPRWPFWLLLAAWVCANSPQIATYAVLSWMAEARSFTHQQRLTADVAYLLAGEKAPARFVKVDEPIPAKPLPPVPPDAVLKKIQLSMERTAEVLPPSLQAMRPRDVSRFCPDSLRAPPPHGPPRIGAV